MIYDLKNIGIPPKPKRSEWASLAKLAIILAVLVWMENRDDEHMKDNQALAETVAYQQAVIDGTGCGASLDMIIPIGLES